MTEKNTLKKSATLAAAGLVVAGALLAGCGESKATPMDDAQACMAASRIAGLDGAPDLSALSL
mgnify:CR=1 FL=1